MSTTLSEYKKTLMGEYVKRDVGAIIQVITDLTKSSEFLALYGGWVRQNKVSGATVKIEEVARVLFEDLERKFHQNDDSSLEVSFDMVANSLGKKFNKEVGRIYLETHEPGDLLEAARFFFTGDVEAMENEKLSETMVDRFKNELIRIEKGRRAVVYVLQTYSHFPIKNVVMLTQLFRDIYLEAKADHKFVRLKPLFWEVLAIANPSLDNNEALALELKKENLMLFADYIATGEEPSLKWTPIIGQGNKLISVSKIHRKQRQLFHVQKTQDSHHRLQSEGFP